MTDDELDEFFRAIGEYIEKMRAIEREVIGTLPPIVMDDTYTFSSIVVDFEDCDEK